MCRKVVTLLCVSSFLSQEANTSLMRSCWNELFILGLAQCAHVMNLSTILTAIINHLQSSIQDGIEHKLYHIIVSDSLLQRNYLHL